MPSLRKRVSSYFRQLSFINEPKERRTNFDENSIVNKYLQGHITLKDGPQILYGKNPTDLPNFDLGEYDKGPETIIGCYSGPSGGLTTVKRTEKHLSLPDEDIDFIDTQEETNLSAEPKRSPNVAQALKVDNTTMVIKVAGQEYCVVNRLKHNKSLSLGSLSDISIEIEKTKICTELSRTPNSSQHSSFSDKSSENITNGFGMPSNENKINISNGNENQSSDIHLLKNKNATSSNVYNEKTEIKEIIENRKEMEKDSNGNKENVKSKRGALKTPQKISSGKNVSKLEGSKQNHNLSKSKSEGNPFHHKKRGRIIKLAERPAVQAETDFNSVSTPTVTIDDSVLPEEWSKKSDHVYGLSDSLYDRNQVTKSKNGDPIADCFGIIARQDSAILAVADGVNWGEKASIAAKSAVHGCLHYLNKTIFNDTKPFVNLTVKDEDTGETDISKAKTPDNNYIFNTREVFVCLLRAFSCAHDLILENQGMLTTLTVAVVLPLKNKNVKRWKEGENGKNGNDAKKPSRTEDRRKPLRIENDKDEQESYVCCVCNVGDTLAYVYSHKYGVRELTKGSHDINCNRDMRDALGALGPVDGINPELSNLTLSLTTLQKGDLVFVASDGLTDNFDPIVCKFAVNSKVTEPLKTVKKPTAPETAKTTEVKQEYPQNEAEHKDVAHERKTSTTKSAQNLDTRNRRQLEEVTAVKAKAPQKPPRKNREKLSQERSSSSRQSSERSHTPSTNESQKSTDSHQSKNVDGICQETKVTCVEVRRIEDTSKNEQSGGDCSVEDQHRKQNDYSSNVTEKQSLTNDQENQSDLQNPLIAQFMRENSLDEKNSLDKLKNTFTTDATVSDTKRTSKGTRTISNIPSKPATRIEKSSHSTAHKKSSLTETRSPFSLQKSYTTKDVHRTFLETKNAALTSTNNRPKLLDIRKSDLKSPKQSESPKYKFLRSKTSIDMRPTVKPILRNEEGLPYVTPLQRYELTLLMIEDILRKGISGQDSECVTAQKLCENLINFTLSITAAKRHMLEDVDLYFNNVNGILIEVSAQEKKLRRRRALDRVQNLPGKLDHVTVVAYNVGVYGN